MKIETNGIQDFLGKSPPNQLNSARALSNGDADASLQADYASLIDQATQIPHTDTSAVQQAQQLLLSGQLESPENIQAAAENIVKFGI